MSASRMMTRLSNSNDLRCKLIIVVTMVTVVCVINTLFICRASHEEVVTVEAEQEQAAKPFCVHPDLPLWPTSFRKFFRKLPPLECRQTEENWVYIENGTFRISPAATKRHGAISCDYTPLLFNTDFDVQWGQPVANMTCGSPLTSDFFRVDCTAKDDAVYENLHAGIVRTKEPTVAPTIDRQSSLGLNVLMVGFDSVSRLMWKRMLPKTYDYLVKVLGAVVLEGYNIVGDATTAALLPMFTGKHEQELPESRRNMAGAQTVDGYPWVWKDYKKLGYVTQMAEDAAWLGSFTLRLNGFEQQPVDHYMRTFYLEADTLHDRSRNMCMGSLSRHVVHLNYARDLYRTYPVRTRKFSFMFHVELTHASQRLLQLADDDVLAFLKDMDDARYLNDTVLIMMADHGPRFPYWRDSVQGKLEERNPFMSFRFPPSFENTHPEAMKNLRTNAQRLSTPFDIHATLRDIANYSGVLRGDSKQRGISLLSEIPANRTCEQADIAPHWCTCLTWTKLDVGDETVKKAAAAMVVTINNQTESQRNKCETLSLAKITRAVRYTPDENIIKYKASVDEDHYKPDFSDNMTNTYVLYQLTFRTNPGQGLYEGTTTHHVINHKFESSVRQISRINKYGNQPHCVMKELPHLRKFCYCKNQIDRTNFENDNLFYTTSNHKSRNV